MSESEARSPYGCQEQVLIMQVLAASIPGCLAGIMALAVYLKHLEVVQVSLCPRQSVPLSPDYLDAVS